MAFIQTVTQRPISFGNRRMSWGTFDFDGVNAGDLDTGMRMVDFIALTPNSDTDPTAQVKTDETFPCAGNAVTVGCSVASVQGNWFAVGL